MFRWILRALAALFISNPGGAAGQIKNCALADVILEGDFDDIKKRAELSGAAHFRDFLIVISNEAVGPEKQNALQIFKADGSNSFQWVRDEAVFGPEDDGCSDADLEGIAIMDDHAYVVGSHALAEEKGGGRRANRQCDRRRSLVELRLGADGRVVSRKAIDLARHIAQHAVLAPFTDLSNADNGIDIEGIAITAEQILIGFRGPVLRDGTVPVLVLNRQDPAQPSAIRHVQLGGRGIRDMARVSDGFLLIAGPAAGPDVPSDIVWWDGQDMLPSAGNVGVTKPVCRLTDRKAEGLAVRAESPDAYDVLIVFDGSRKLKAKAGRLAK